MISSDLVTELKKRYGRIFSLSARGVDYIFREITFGEYEEVLSYPEDSAEAEDLLVKTALLHPTDVDFDSIPAGIISSLAEEILELSGFGTPATAKRLLEEKRLDAQEVRGLMKAFVISTMPAYKEEELDNLTFSQMAAKVALAEQIIRINQSAFGIENDITLDLIDPVEEAMREEAEAQRHASTKKPGQAGYKDPIAEKLRSALG